MGNTRDVLMDENDAEDHPHIHGESHSANSRTAITRGSPPHTWGILMSAKARDDRARITPTYMGNTVTRLTPVPFSKDHPHIHGEYGPYEWSCKSL